MYQVCGIRILSEAAGINLNRPDTFSTSNNLDYLDTTVLISVESNPGRN